MSKSKRGVYSDKFKSKILAECEEPGCVIVDLAKK